MKELNTQSISEFTKFIDQHENSCSSNAPLKNQIENSPLQAKRRQIFGATLQTLAQDPNRPLDTRNGRLTMIKMIMKKKTRKEMKKKSFGGNQSSLGRVLPEPFDYSAHST
jgi:hypothetical protein